MTLPRETVDTTGQPATQRQLKFLVAIARDIGETEDVAQEVDRLYGCPIEQLTRRQAAVMIQRVQARRAGRKYDH